MVGDNNEYFKENVDRSISQAHRVMNGDRLNIYLVVALGVNLIHFL